MCVKPSPQLPHPSDIPRKVDCCLQSNFAMIFESFVENLPLSPSTGTNEYTSCVQNGRYYTNEATVLSQNAHTNYLAPLATSLRFVV